MSPDREQPPRILARKGVAVAVAGGVFLAAAVMAVATPGPTPIWLRGGITYLDEERVVRQVGPTDCGVAALDMVYRDLGLPPELLADIRAQVLERDEGLTMLEMRDLALEHGLDAGGWRFEETDLRGLAALGLPLVAHVADHYVVIDRVGPDWVELRDPSAGRLRVSQPFFERWWTGNVLSLKATETSTPLSDR